MKACYDCRRDFLALVDQTVEFARLQCEMGATAAEVTDLAQTNVRDAEREIQERTRRITNTSAESARSMLWVADLATLLGVIFAVTTTRNTTSRS